MNYYYYKYLFIRSFYTLFCVKYTSVDRIQLISFAGHPEINFVAGDVIKQ